MNSRLRRVVTAVVAVGLAIVGAVPAGAATTVHVDEYRLAGSRAISVAAAPAPCTDRAYRLLGAKWTTTYRWSFKAASTPKSMTRATVRSILKRSFSNITNARNDCGRDDTVGATHEYLGNTSRRPDCSQRDGRNVIGFGRLRYGVLAVTCYWIRNGRMVEADIKINNREEWATRLRGCRFGLMLEATVTHEAGHVFGLDHVGERRHGRLTMSTYLDGPCQNQEATLGRGDMLGLEVLY
jgi:hypothetical protein